MMTDICERLVRFAGKVCLSTDTEVEAAAEIERLRRQLAPFKERYDKFIKVAELEGKTLDEIITIAEEVNKQSLQRSIAGNGDEMQEFWIDCDLAAHFELMCVKLIREANDE